MEEQIHWEKITLPCERRLLIHISKASSHRYNSCDNNSQPIRTYHVRDWRGLSEKAPEAPVITIFLCTLPPLPSFITTTPIGSSAFRPTSTTCNPSKPATPCIILDTLSPANKHAQRPRQTMNFLHSTLDRVREWAPVSHTSTFRQNGQITPEEFVAAGDYLVYMFPTWSWADASPTSKRVSYLPEGKQFLVTRGVPCHRRLDENFAGDAGQDEAMVGDGEDFKNAGGHSPGDDEDGWLRTGGLAASQEARARDVRTVDESGNMGEREEDEDEIPDMEDDDDEDAIIRDPKADGADSYVSTKNLRLSGYHANCYSIQITTNIYPLHCIHTLLPNPSTLPLWIPRQLATTWSTTHDGRYCWRLQRQDCHVGRLPIL